MKIHILGSGTSAGVPVIGCDCQVCVSEDPKTREQGQRSFRKRW